MIDCIQLYPDMVDPALCRALIAEFERDPRKRPGVAYGRAQAKRSTDLGLRGLPE